MRGSYCAEHGARYLVRPAPLKMCSMGADRFKGAAPEDRIPAYDMDGLRAELRRRAARPRS